MDDDQCRPRQSHRNGDSIRRSALYAPVNAFVWGRHPRLQRFSFLYGVTIIKTPVTPSSRRHTMRTRPTFRPFAGGLIAVALFALAAGAAIPADLPQVRIAVTSTDGYTHFPASRRTLGILAACRPRRIRPNHRHRCGNCGGRRGAYGRRGNEQRRYDRASACEKSAILIRCPGLDVFEKVPHPNAQFVVMPAEQRSYGKGSQRASNRGRRIRGRDLPSRHGLVDRSERRRLDPEQFIEVPPAEQIRNPAARDDRCCCDDRPRTLGRTRSDSRHRKPVRRDRAPAHRHRLVRKQ